MRKTRESRNTGREDKLETGKAILTALAKATGDDASLTGNIDEPSEETNFYYTLTSEEIAALINGNMEKIENWVSKLDKRHATWLLRWLIKESW